MDKKTAITTTLVLWVLALLVGVAASKGIIPMNIYSFVASFTFLIGGVVIYHLGNGT